jgi:hypothetical protein
MLFQKKKSAIKLQIYKYILPKQQNKHILFGIFFTKQIIGIKGQRAEVPTFVYLYGLIFINKIVLRRLYF